MTPVSKFKFTDDRYKCLLEPNSGLSVLLQQFKSSLFVVGGQAEKIADCSYLEGDWEFSVTHRYKAISELDEEDRRMLKYAYRDWKSDVEKRLSGTSLLSSLQSVQLLEINNLKLFSTPGEWGGLQWKVCLGFEFDSYGDNFLPDNLGVYKSRDIVVENEIMEDSHSDKPDSSSFKYNTAKFVHNGGHQQNTTFFIWVVSNWKWLLGFCLGFFLASVLSYFFSNCCSCDHSIELESLLIKLNQCCH